MLSMRLVLTHWKGGRGRGGGGYGGIYIQGILLFCLLGTI